MNILEVTVKNNLLCKAGNKYLKYEKKDVVYETSIT